MDISVKSKLGKEERGQTMVIFAIALVGIIAFIALAADAGQLYVERRNAQSAADSAAFAAAAAKVKGKNLEDAGEKVAAANGFDNDGTTNTVSVFNPPTSGPYQGKNNYVQVIIASTVKTSFLHIFSRNEIVNVSEAVVEAGTNGPAFGNNTLVVTKESGCDTFTAKGDVTVVVQKGNIWVNSPGSGSDGKCAFDVNDKAVNITLSDGTVYTVGTGIEDPKGRVDASQDIAIKQAKQNFVNVLPVPDCDLVSNFSDDPSYEIDKGSFSGSGPIYPGVYDSITADNKGTTTFMPGLYCVKGDIGGKGDFAGENVLIVMQGGNFNMTGSKATATLKAHSSTYNLKTVKGSTVDFKGMLIMSGDYDAAHNYYSTGDLREFSWQGNASFDFTGTVYLPEVSCNLGGTPAGKASKTQLICYTYQPHGTPDFWITLDSNAVFNTNGGISLIQ